MKEELLTIQQAADFLSVSTKTLRRWEARGVLNPARTVGNQRRYTLAELQEFKAKGKPAFQTVPTANQVPIVSQEETQTNQTPVQTTPVEPQLHNSVNTQPFISSSPFQTLPVQPLTQDVPVRQESGLPVQDQLTNVQDRVQVLKQHVARKKAHSFSSYAIAGLIVFTALLMATMYGPVKTASELNLSKNSSGINVDKQSVLAAETKGRNLIGDVLFNVPAIFEGKVTVENDFVVNGKSLFNEDVTVANKNVSLGTGKLTASNVVYGLTAGANITITGDPQNPTISAGLTGGIESFQGQSGVVTLVEGDGVGIDGLTITNTGVLSLAGETGDVELTAGDGIAIDGTTIANDDPGSAQNIFKTILVDATEIIAGSNDDIFTITAGSGITITPDADAKSITINSSVGSGLSGLTTYGVLYATSTTEATSTTDGTTGTVLKGVTGGAPVFGAVSLTADVSDVLPIANGGTGLGTTPSNGQLLIGNGTGYTLSTITGAMNQITVNNSAGSIGLSTPQDIHTGAMPTFATLNLTASANQLVLGTGNTATITTASLNNPRSYTLPNLSGEICLSSGNCSGSGGTLIGSGTTNYIPRFTSASGIGDSSIYDDGKVAIGTASPQGLFNVIGRSTGKGLVMLNETGDQDILAGSSSGTTRFVFDGSGNLNITGSGYQIGGVNVLSSTGLGATVVASSLTSVSTLDSGAISAGFGAIDTGTDAISGGNLTGTGATGLTLSGNGAGIVFSGTGTHSINASSGTMQLGALTLTGAVNGNGQNVTGVNNLSASGSIQFGGLGIGVVQSNGSGDISSAALNIGGGASYISGTLPTTNGGTGLTSYAVGDLIYASGANTLASRAIGTDGQVLTVSGGVPSWTDVSGSINFWQNINNAISPINSQNDVLIGSNATGSAKFAFKNVASGTPTASISAGTSGGVYLTAGGTLSTTAKQSITIGSADSGNIVLSGFGTGIVKSNAAGVLSSSAINLASTDVTGLLGVTNGGTGASDASGARTNLGAAASGANADITSLSGLTTALSVGQGGTGTTTLTSNGVLYGNGTGAIGATVAGTTGQLLLGQTGSAPSFQTLGGDATINASGVLAIGADAVALGGDTTGNFVANISGGSGIGISGSAGEGWTPTVALAALTGDWDQTGAFDIVLNNAGSELRILESTGGSFYGTIDVGDLSGNQTYSFPATGGTICIVEAANCTGGGGGGVSTAGGTTNRLTRFTGATAIGDASIDDLYASGVAMTLDSTGRVGIGTANPLAQLHVNGIATGGNAAVIVNQTAANDIITASASGVTRFVVNNNGNIQFSGNTSFLNTLTSLATQNQTYTLPDASGTICLTTGNCAGSGGGLTGSGTVGQIAYFNGAGTLTSDTTGFSWDATNDRLGIGNDSPVAKLDLTGAVAGKALAIFNQTGDQDIFSASASGTTRLTLSSAGNLNLTSGSYQIGGASVLNSTTLGSSVINSSLQTVGTIGTGTWQATAIGAQYGGTGDNTSGTTGVPYIAAGNWQYETQLSSARGGTSADLSGAAQGAIPYFSATGVMSALAPATAGYVLSTNGAGQNPSWVATSSLGTNYWDSANGALSPKNAASMDLLLGATATSEAKFAFKNVSGGTPTASISAGLAGALYLTADGTIATTARQSLVLGTNTTGDIILNPNGNIAIGNATPGSDKLSVTGNTRVTGDVRSSSGFYQSGATDTVIGNDNNGSNIRFTTATGEKVRIGDSGNVGVGTTNLLGKFNVSGAASGKALAILDETGDQNIIAGSASGVTRFTVDRSGNVNSVGGGYRINGTTVIDSSANITNVGTINSTYLTTSTNLVNLGASTALQFNGTTVIDASRNLTNIAGVTTNLNPTVNNTYSLGASGNQYSNIYGQTVYQNGNQVCDTSGNCAGQTTTYWNETNGALSPKNITVDLLVGGATSDSAKFGVLNVSGGTPTASLSAGTTGGTFLTAAGTLQTTSGQTLYLGGGNTGNIVLNSGPGGITIQDGVTLNGNLTQTGTSSFTTGTGLVTLNGNVDATNGLDVSGAALNIGGSNASISIAGAIVGTQLDIDGSITINGNIISASSGDLTLGALDGNIFIGNGVALNGGGAAGASYNFFANVGETADQANILDDNDLYIGGNLEVDGTIYQGDNEVCDISGNCAGSTNYLQSNSGNLAPGNAALATDRFVLGGNTTTPFQFEVNGRQTGKGLVSLNETGNQDILTGSASGTTVFTFDRSGNLILTGDLQVGTIGLNNIGTNNTDSGASLIGVFDEFSNSSGTTIQDVLDDLDNAIGAGSSKWTVSGNIIYPITAGTQVGIGTTTAGDVASSFYLTRDQAQGALGKSLAILNQTENQDIFTASSAGATRFTIANNGNITATGTLTGLTGLSSSGTINLSSVTANRALFSDGSSNVTGSGNSAALLNALTDETGSGFAVFATSPSFTTSILTGSSSFDLINTNASTINFAGDATTLAIGATSGTATLRNGVFNLSNGLLQTGGIERLSNSGALANINGYAQISGGFEARLTTTNQAVFSSTTANSDTISLAPNTSGSNTFTGTLTTADLTGNQTYTLPNASGTICVSGQSCAASGTVGYLTRTGTNLSPATATDTLSIGTTSPLATFDVRGLSGTSPIASFSGQTALAGLLVDNNGLGDIFTASKGGATKFTLLNNGNIRINNLANCTALETDTTGLVNCGTDDLGTGGDGSSNWRIVNGAISPNNDTLDLLLGSSSSSSARFAFMNVNPGSGTPTASIAGTANNALYLTGNGTISTTNKQSLSLGSASTGNVSLTGSRLQFTNLTGCDTIDTDANGFLTCGSDAGGAGGAGSINIQSNGVGVGTVDTIDFSALFNVSTSPSTTAHVTIENDVLNFSHLSNSLSVDAATSIALNDFNLSIGTNVGNGGVIVAPNAGGNSALIVNKQGTGDIFAASSSGTSRFRIGGNGDLIASGTLTGLTGLTSSGTVRFSTLTNAGGVVFTDGSGIISQTSVGASNQCLVGGATPTWANCDSASATYWQFNNGALATGNNTYDLLIGGTSTESAKFAVTNIAGGTPTASISAQSGTNSALVLGSNGTIQTVKNQTLTLGGSTTGNILLDEQTDLGSGVTGLRISTGGGISDIDGNIGLSDNTDVTGNLDASGTLTAGTADAFTVGATGIISTLADETINGIDISAGAVSDVTNLTINGGGDLTIGTIGLNDVGTSNTDSGGALIGLFDEFTNSNATTVQDVLDDFDAAIGAGSSKWQLNSNALAPATVTNQVVLGGNTTTPYQFEVNGKQTGKALVSLNETGDQNILTGSASGTTRFTFDRTGGLNLIGGNVQISGTNVIDSSRNLNNIGTIDSTYLDASSNVVNLGPSTELQFNGTSVITAALNIQNISGIATDLVPTVNNTYDLGSSARRYAEIHGQAIYQAGNQVCDSSGNCAGTTNYLQLNSGTIAPGNAANAADRFVLGGNSTTTPFQFEVNGKQTGKALVSLNETGNQAILTGSASGTTVFTFDRSGNLSLEGSLSDIGGNLILDDTVDLGSSANGINITTAGVISDNNGNISLNDNTDVTGNFDASGTLTAGTADAFTVGATGIIGTLTDETINGIDINAGAVSDVTNLTINGGGDLTIGAIGLNDPGTNNTTSGGSLVGLFDEFANSNSTTVQDVLDDLDAAIAGASQWQLASNVIAPLTATDRVVLGGNTTTPFQFEVNGKQTGKALVSLNETGNQNILTGSASGTTVFTFDRSGNLSLEGSISDIGGNLVLDDTVDLGSSANGINITTAGVISDNNGNISLNDNTDVTGNFDASGTLTAGTADAFTVGATGVIGTITDETINGIDINAGAVSDVTNLTINGGGTLTIGTTALNETTGPTDSGAYLVGVNDEFDNSNSTTVQGVLNDLDAAVGAGSSKWTASGNVIYPATAGRQVGVGTTTAGSIISSFYVTRDLTQGALGKATAIINQTENQDIFAASASGTTRVVINNSGYLGLDTATPRSLFDLGTDGGIMTIGGLSSGGQINFGASGGANSVRFSNNELALYTSQSNGLKFYTNSDSDTATAELTIEDDGDIVFGSATYANCGMLTTSSNVVTCSSAPTGTNYWQTNSGALAPGGSASVTDKLVLGGNTTTSNQFEVNGKQTGKALVSLNETGNQDVLTGSASGTTVFTFDRSGNLTLEGALSDLSGATLAINDNLDASGTLTAGTADAFTVGATGVISTLTNETINGIDINAGAVSDVTNLTINGGGDLTIGTIGLNDVGTSNTDSGGALVGLFDEFTNSSATTVQDVLDDFDAAIGAGSSKWQLNSNALAPATVTNQVVLGGNTTTSFQFEVNGKQSGKALVALNETGNQNILTGSASGTTVFTFDRSGNLTLEGALSDISGNLVLDDTVDLGSSANGINITTAGVISDNNGNISLNDNTDVTGNFDASGTLTAGTADAFTVGATGVIGTLTDETINGIDINAGAVSDVTNLTINGGGDLTIGTIGLNDVGSNNTNSGGALVGLFDEFTNSSATTLQDVLDDFDAAIGAGSSKWQLNSNALAPASVNNQVVLGGNTTTPFQFEVNGKQSGKALVSLNETGNQAVLTGSASGTTIFTFDRSGNLSLEGAISDITNAAVSINDDLDVSGTLTAGTTDAFTVGATGVIGTIADETINGIDINAGAVSDVTNLTINGGGDLTIGTIGLNDVGSSNTNSGGALIGLFDEFTNSSATTVQDVLDDFDAAIGAGSSKWQLNSNALAPATVTNQVVLGGNTTTSFQFEVNGKQTGKALVSLNETGNQAILTGSASGTTVFTFDRSGNLAVEGTITDIGGNLVLDDTVDLGSATNGINITTAGVISDNNGNISLNDNTDVTGNFDASGTLTAGTADAFTVGATGVISTLTNETINGIDINAGAVSDVTNLTINGGGDLTIGAIGLNDVGTSNTDSGGALIGLFDEFANSSSTTVQDVIDDLDAAITSGTSKWQLNSGALAPATASNQVVLGGNTTTPFQFEVNGKQSGKALVSLNETGNQNILTGSASGTTVFTFDRSGNLTLEGAISDIGGNLVLDDTVDLGGAANGINITTAGVISDNNSNVSINDNTDVTGNFDASGTLTAGTANAFTVAATGDISTVTNETINGIDISAGTVSDVANLTINGGGDLTIGTIGLNDVGTSNTDSGGALIGLFDEFTNSSATTVQDVLDDFDAAIGAGSSKWQLNSNALAPASVNNQVVLGGNTTTPFQFEVNGKQTGKALVSLNETGNQAVLTGSASGTTVFTFDRSGNLALEGALSDLSGVTLAINDNLDVSGTLTAGTADAFTVGATGVISTLTDETINGVDINAGAVSDVTNLTINGGGDLTIGTIGLNDVGTNNTTSGSSLIGLFDEFTNSSATTVQDVIDDLDAAITSGTSKWQLNSGALAPTTASNQVVLGGNTTTPFQFEVNGRQTGKALVSLNETGNQAVLTGSASGTTVFTFDRSGNLSLEGALSDLSGTNLAINDNVDVTGNFDASGTLTAGTADAFTVGATGVISTLTNETINGIDISAGAVSDVTNLTINGGGDLTIGTIGLNDVGTSNTDSGGALIGLFDEFTNSSATTLQDVLDDFDAAIGAGSSKWQLNSGALAPATVTNQVVLGGNTTTSYQFEVNGKQTGKALVSLNETGNQNILTGSASGTTVFNFDRSGNLAIEGQLSDLSNTNLAINDNVDVTGNFDASGTLTAGTANVFGVAATGDITSVTNETINGIDINAGAVSDVTNLTINGGGDLTIGTIGLNDVGTNNTTSGGSLIGLFDEFANSSATTVQDVIDDLDAAIGAGSSKWQSAGNVLAPLTANDRVALGGNTTTSFQFEVNGKQSGKALVSLNETGNQAVLTGSASGTTVFTFDHSGNLSLEGAISDIGGNLVLDDTVDLGSVANGINITTAGVISDNNGNISLNDNTDVTGNFDASGTLTAGTANAFTVAATGDISTVTNETINGIDISAGTVSDVANLTINGGGDLTIGTIGLNDVGTNNTTSGGSLIGLFDEFTNSSATTVQDVIDDLDAAIAGGSSKWQLASNVLAPLTANDRVALGGNTTTSFQFEVNGKQTGKALVSLNETGNQNILTGSASGTTMFNFDRTGNLAIEGQLSDLTQGTLAINDDLQVVGNDILDSGAATRITLGATNTITGTNLTLSGTTTLDATALTSINGGATAISFTEFGVDAATGGVTINDGGNLGYLLVEATRLDIDSLTFPGTGLINTTSTNPITVDAGSTYVKIGATATSPNFASDEDLFVIGDVELDGTLYAAGDILGAATTNLLNTTTTTLNFAGAATTLNIADAAITGTIDIGGVTNNGATTVNIATNGTSADTITIGNSTATTLMTLTGGDDWSITSAGLLTLDGTQLSQTALSFNGAPTISSTGNMTFQANSGNGEINLSGDVYAGDGTNWAYGINGTGQGLSAWGRAATNTQILGSNATGDSDWRFLISANGQIDWGGGVTATDISLYRESSTNLRSNAGLRLGSSTGPATSGTLDVRGNSGTQPVASIAGTTSFASMVVNNHGVGDLFTASKSGKTHFTIRNSGAVVIGNTTNGITFDVNNPNVVYSGNARPSKSIVLSAEYPGAALTASVSAGTNHTGYMTSDASASAALSNFMNYYEWSTDSTQGTLQDYTVAVRVTLPHDFGAWQTSNALTIKHNTELGGSGSNKLDVIVYNATTGLNPIPVAYYQAISTTAKTWTDFAIDDSDLTNGTEAWDTAGETAVIYLRMYSRHANHIQVGDITLNYLGRN